MPTFVIDYDELCAAAAARGQPACKRKPAHSLSHSHPFSHPHSHPFSHSHPHLHSHLPPPAYSPHPTPVSSRSASFESARPSPSCSPLSARAVADYVPDADLERLAVRFGFQAAVNVLSGITSREAPPPYETAIRDPPALFAAPSHAYGCW